MSNQENKTVMDIRKIMQHLPHRYPFLLVDRVTSLEPGVSICAYKNVTLNENFFQGHFPELPVMPGVLIMEALAQAGGLMVISAIEQSTYKDSLFLFTGMEKVRFRRPVYPGDRLDLHCTLLRNKLRIWKMEGKAYVDGVLAAEGELSAAVSNRNEM